MVCSHFTLKQPIYKIKIFSTCEQPYKAFTKFYNFWGKFTQWEKKAT